MKTPPLDLAAAVEIRQEPGWLYIRLPALDNIERAKALVELVARECAARGATRLLLDTTATERPLPVLANLDLADHCAAINPAPLKVANFLRIEATYPDRFFENAVRNRGVNYRWFTDRREAECWLTGDASGSGAIHVARADGLAGGSTDRR